MAQFYWWLCFLLHLILCRCYILPSQKDFANDNRKDWAEAESYCLSTYNSHLLSIHDSHSFQALRNKIISIGQDANHFWIGLMNKQYPSDTRQSSTVNYTWSDDTPFDFGTDLSSGSFPWFDERPESPSTDRYVRLWGGSASLLWDDTHHQNEYFWICNESPPTLKPYDDDDTDQNASNEASDSMDHVHDDTTRNTTASSHDAQATKTIDGIFPQQTSNTTETDGNDAILLVQAHDNDLNLTTFWKFALFAILILSTCIILLRLRIIYRSYSHKRRASSIGIGPRQITDLSAIESGTHSHLHKLHRPKSYKRDDDMMAIARLPFASIDQREDSLEICNEMAAIAPFATSVDEASDDIPQVPTACVAQGANTGPLQIAYDSKVSLEIEYDVTSHNSVEGALRSQPGMVINNIIADSDSNHSMIATFDVHTMIHCVDEHDKISDDMQDIEEQRRSILLIMQQNENSNETEESYEEETLSYHSKEQLKFTNRSSCNSLHSTMAAFDAQSFKMKGDEFSDGSHATNTRRGGGRRRNDLRHEDGELMQRKSVRQMQYAVSGETSDDCSETHIEHEHDDEDMDVPDLPMKKRESDMSLKESEIKANISQIMENLKRMKNLSNGDGNTMVMD